MAAGLDLDWKWVPVAGRAALDDVGDVTTTPVNGELLGQQPIEELAGPSDERLTGEVLVLARRFADQHQASGGIPRREDHLGPSRGQGARNAGERLSLELGEGRH